MRGKSTNDRNIGSFLDINGLQKELTPRDEAGEGKWSEQTKEQEEPGQVYLEMPLVWDSGFFLPSTFHSFSCLSLLPCLLRSLPNYWVNRTQQQQEGEDNMRVKVKGWKGPGTEDLPLVRGNLNDWPLHQMDRELGTTSLSSLTFIHLPTLTVFVWREWVEEKEWSEHEQAGTGAGVIGYFLENLV